MITVLAVLLAAKARCTVLGLVEFLMAVFIEGPFAGIHPQDDMTAIPSVSPIRSASFDKLLPTEAGAACAAVSGPDGDNDFINEFHAA